MRATSSFTKHRLRRKGMAQLAVGGTAAAGGGRGVCARATTTGATAGSAFTFHMHFSSHPHPAARRIVGRHLNDLGRAFLAHHVHRQRSAHRCKVTINQREREGAFQTMPVASRGRHADDLSIGPDGFKPLRVGVGCLDLQHGQHLVWRRCSLRCLFADKVTLVPGNPAFQPGLGRSVALGELGVPDANALFQTHGQHRPKADFRDAVIAASL